MGFLFKKRENPAEPEALVKLAKDGIQEAREDLIRRYTPFVLRVAARVTGRYLAIGRDDEVSVGLIAFNEAIDGFDPASGASFLGFAEMVIRRRLIDHFRRHRMREVPLAEFDQEDEEGGTYNLVEVQGALAEHVRSQENEARRQEIERLAASLARFGIRFADLVEQAPQHEDARRRAMNAARLVAGKAEYSQYLYKYKALPLKELAAEPEVGVSRKTLERQRKYIVAVAVILLEDLTTLREYIKL